MFASIPTPSGLPFNFAHVVVVLASCYYFQFRNFPLLIAVWILSAICLAAVFLFGEHRLLISIMIFAIAWIGQFVGHKVEGKKPSFFEDIFFLLIGPLWVIYKIVPSIFPSELASSTELPSAGASRDS